MLSILSPVCGLAGQVHGASAHVTLGRQGTGADLDTTLRIIVCACISVYESVIYYLIVENSENINNLKLPVIPLLREPTFAYRCAVPIYIFSM